MADVELNETNCIDVKLPALARQVRCNSGDESEVVLIIGIDRYVHHIHNVGQKNQLKRICTLRENAGDGGGCCFRLCDMSIKNNQEVYDEFVAIVTLEKL